MTIILWNHLHFISLELWNLWTNFYNHQAMLYKCLELLLFLMVDATFYVTIRVFLNVSYLSLLPILVCRCWFQVSVRFVGYIKLVHRFNYQRHLTPFPFFQILFLLFFLIYPKFINFLKTSFLQSYIPLLYLEFYA